MTVVISIFVIYSLSLLLRIDAIQHRLACHITEWIHNKSNLPIDIGGIQVKHLNKIEINDILLNDLSGDTLIGIEKLTAHISPLYLLQNKVRINSVMLAKPTVKITRADSLSETNIQFLLDLFAGKENTSNSSIPNIRINQLHIYDGKFSFHELSAHKNSNGLFSPKYTDLENISTNISLKELSEDTLRLHVRSFSATESSGLQVSNIKMRLRASKRGAEITKLNIEFPNSNIKADKLSVFFSSNNEKKSHISKFIGELRSDKITPRDFATINSLLTDLPPLAFNIVAKGDEETIDINEFTLKTIDNNILIDASLKIDREENNHDLKIKRSFITTDGMQAICRIANIDDKTKKIISKSGYTALTGEATKSGNDITCNATLLTESGNIKASLSTDNEKFVCNINGKEINMGKIIDNPDLKTMDIESIIKGTYKSPTCYSGEFTSTISSIEYKNYKYSPIAFAGSFNEKEKKATIDITDKNISTKIALGINNRKDLPEFDIRIKTDSINLQPLNLFKDIENYTVAFRLEANFKGNNADYGLLTANMYDFELFTPDKYWKIRHLNITENSLNERRMQFINSDIFNSYISGNYNYADIGKSLFSIIDKHIPALNLQNGVNNDRSNFVFNIDIFNSEAISKLFNLPVTIHSPSKIEGSFDGKHKYAKIIADINNIDIANKKYNNITFNANSHKKKLSIDSKVTTLNDSKAKGKKVFADNLVIAITGTAHNDTLYNTITIKDVASNDSKGGIEFETILNRDHNKNLTFATRLQPGNIIYEDSIWNIADCNIKGNNSYYTIENFELSNNNRKLHINGAIGPNMQDSLRIDLKEINLEDIMNIINFHSVDFGGIANGYIDMSQLLNGPKLSSELNVKKFKFEKGIMGELALKGKWEEDCKSVLLSGEIDNNNKKSIVNGLVSPANDTICIGLEANGANIAFLNNILSSALTEVKGEANGMLFVKGKLSDINLYGALATSGSLRLKPTNVIYNLRGDTLQFTHNKISFNNFGINDTYGNRGFINGSVNHKSLSKFTCKFNINANNLLAYDTYSFGNDDFYGKAFVSGNATFSANNNGIRLNAEITTGGNSKFVYNATGTQKAENKEFITFVDKKARKRNVKDSRAKQETEYRNDKFTSNLRLDFMINTTPDLQLRVYTNTITNDYIDIYGNGLINAIYDEIEGFNMKGNLDIAKGTYKFTLQEIIPKEFSIKEGRLEFNGDPFLANLNLKTAYTVPSAPLTDLSMSAEQRKNVKVNCLMDITGTLQNPTLTFGLELPDGNEEEKELLANATSTPEQTNMQFIYLIGIGKFYTYDYNNQENENGSSTAMESLLSNTISGQFNNLLSQIIDNDNWKLSSNFTTSEKNWNSMEVEGMLSGRMLNNRLLINGNFGYRDTYLANKNFIGDFEIQWLLNNKGNISLKAYNKTNDRYFSKTTLTTQGAGILLRHDFDNWLFWRKKHKENNSKK